MKLSRTFAYGDQTVTIETGEMARQADGATLVTMGDTVVLVTAVGQKGDSGNRDFFPLTVNYQEKTFAAGRIPGGFFKREGRPSEKETLTCRADRSTDPPAVPQAFRNDVQVIATVLSVDPEINPDIPSMIGASAALAISGLPFSGPIGATRVGYRDGAYIANPGMTALVESDLDLVVAGTKNAVLMVESEANMLSEEVMLGAVLYGHELMQTAIQAIEGLAAEIAKAPMEWSPPQVDEQLTKSVEATAGQRMADAYEIVDKTSRRAALAGR